MEWRPIKQHLVVSYFGGTKIYNECKWKQAVNFTVNVMFPHGGRICIHPFFLSGLAALSLNIVGFTIIIIIIF